VTASLVSHDDETTGFRSSIADASTRARALAERRITEGPAMAMEGTVQSIEVSAPPQLVYEVALDLEEYPQWATGVKEVVIHDEDDDGRPVRVSFVADAMIKEIAYTLLYRYDLDNGFSWAAEPGDDIKAMDGSYEFNLLADGGTEVLYALKVEPAFTVPGFLRRQAEKQIVSSALRGLKRRAESAE